MKSWAMTELAPDTQVSRLHRSLRHGLCAAGLVLGICAQDAYAGYSLVINNGRVIDPETRLDAISHIGLDGGRIAAVSRSPLEGEHTIDASGLVVAPGFIDLHTHSPTQLGQYYQLFDGVTTALELEAGAYPVQTYGAAIRDTPLINFGASAGYLNMRMLVKDGLHASSMAEQPRPEGLWGWWNAARAYFGGPGVLHTLRERATPEELHQLKLLLESTLDDGALGIGLPLDYFSEAAASDEVRMIFTTGAARGAPIFIHIRRGINGDPAGLREVLELAADTGASIHICHITHNAMRNIELFLQETRQARERGVDVTVGVLPYNAGSTTISAAVFNRDWQRIFGIAYGDVEWAATGERLTAESWERYRREQPAGAVIHHYLREPWTRRALQEPGSIVVSDLLPMQSREQKVAPHNGAFSKVLGRYVREQQLLDLPAAIEKMTLLPARRLQDYALLFRRKGRIQVGMDADIVVFDADRILDRASYRDPYREAAGIEHIVIGGIAVVRYGRLVPDVYPGRRISAIDVQE